MKKIILFFLCLTISSLAVWAQPDLPNVATLSQSGINILSWNSPYTSGVRAVTVERTSGSEVPYVEIGAVKDITRPSQYFTDANPLPGKNFYRVKLLFNSNLEWYSNEVLITVDSNLDYRKVVPTKDSIEKLVNELGVTTQIPTNNYQISTYVYTNPYNGNINIELNNALDIAYKIEFYDAQGKKVLEIPRVNDNLVVLDKRNFQHNGYYRFVVFKENKEFAEGTVAVY